MSAINAAIQKVKNLKAESKDHYHREKYYPVGYV